jgi:hypothetical protein
MSLPDSSVSAIDDGPFRFVPCLKLRHETLLSSSLDQMRKPHLVAVMDLGFDYRGVLVRAGERPTAERDIALHASRDSCTLFDTPSLVRHLEELYGQMWEQFEKGVLPRPDLANLDVYLEIGNQVDHEEMEVQSIADYRSWWLERLVKRHSFRPIAPDRRFVQGMPFDSPAG